MSHKILGIDIGRVDTTPQHELGLIVRDIIGGQGTRSYKEVIDGATITQQYSPDAEFKYVRAQSNVAVGDSVILDTGQTDEPAAVIPVSAVNQPVEGIARVAIAANSYGWVQVRGRVPSAKVAAGTAAGAQLGSSGTAGTLSTITVATPTAAEVQRVLAAAIGRGAQAMDAEAGGLAEVYLY